MRTVSYEEFLKFRPCWLKNDEGRRKLERIGKRKKRWTALDVLRLPKWKVSDKDKRWAVLREEFIEPEILHEFACRCAEEALKGVENPDPRSLAAIDAKRKWLREEIGDEELLRAQAAAQDAAWDAAWDATMTAAWSAASDAQAAAWAGAWVGDWVAARAAFWATTRSAGEAAFGASSCIPRPIPLLRELLEGVKTEKQKE